MEHYNNSMNERLKGIWIPIEIFQIDNISITDKLILSVITHLHIKSNEPFFGSNNYFENLFDISKRTVQNSLATLKELDLIEVEFKNNNQTRLIKTNVVIVINSSKIKIKK